jgi:hypothetical protein|uniref:Uncharacterized protein n=1 Tax=Candidatus Methanophagaceae archaeon ANME-1 ERB6 TaxID=2759912 RepID=A0A7G9YZI4_9EURY|nr:hypothetical protein JNHLJEBA_00028 [Methanosarcinales archaeon ANME-1 ERB6]
MATLIVSAAKSKVTIDGEEVSGLQSLDYKVSRRQADVAGVGADERIGIESGLILVTGALRVQSLNKKLDEILYEPVPVSFNMVAELKKGDELVKKITFDECYLDDKSFELGAEGIGITVYTFTSTRVREE